LPKALKSVPVIFNPLGNTYLPCLVYVIRALTLVYASWSSICLKKENRSITNFTPFKIYSMVYLWQWCTPVRGMSVVPLSVFCLLGANCLWFHLRSLGRFNKCKTKIEKCFRMSGYTYIKP